MTKIFFPADHTAASPVRCPHCGTLVPMSGSGPSKAASHAAPVQASPPARQTQPVSSRRTVPPAAPPAPRPTPKAAAPAGPVRAWGGVFAQGSAAPQPKKSRSFLFGCLMVIAAVTVLLLVAGAVGVVVAYRAGTLPSWLFDTPPLPPRDAVVEAAHDRTEAKAEVGIVSTTLAVEGGKQSKPDPKAAPEIGYNGEEAILDGIRHASYLTPSEQDVIVALNEARRAPRHFAERYLAAVRNDKAAAKECYQAMMALAPLPLLRPSEKLSRAAQAHAEDLSRTGDTGHIGSDGSSFDERIKRYGVAAFSCGENCAYGRQDAMAAVVRLLIDENVPSRGHRENILNAEFRFVGVGVRPHATYGTVCVQDFAGEMRDTP